jgi:hypothetical protein
VSVPLGRYTKLVLTALWGQFIAGRTVAPLLPDRRPEQRRLDERGGSQWLRCAAILTSAFARLPGGTCSSSR